MPGAEMTVDDDVVDDGGETGGEDWRTGCAVEGGAMRFESMTRLNTMSESSESSAGKKLARTFFLLS